MTTNQPRNSGIGGATTRSAPQLSPIFSYKSYRIRGEPTIRVYGFLTAEYKPILIVTLQNGVEHPWGMSGNLDQTGIEAQLLIERCAKRWVEATGKAEGNPFQELLNNKQAMETLRKAAALLYLGEK